MVIQTKSTQYSQGMVVQVSRQYTNDQNEFESCKIELELEVKNYSMNEIHHIMMFPTENVKMTQSHFVQNLHPTLNAIDVKMIDSHVVMAHCDRKDGAIGTKDCFRVVCSRYIGTCELFHEYT